MKENHTKGPWIVFTEKAGVPIYIRSEVEYIGSIDINLDGKDNEAAIKRARANATLIAAAPELLESLQGLISLIDEGWLVRSTANDSEPEFVLRQLGPYRKIANAVSAIEKATKTAEKP